MNSVKNYYSMETKFNSQICTSKIQSEKLLALGLKKETADMCSVIDHVSDSGKWEEVDTIFSFAPNDWNFRESVTPRWSLHRLIEMLNIQMQTNGRYIYLADGGFDGHTSLYDNIIDCIEWLIKEGYFNKEYLV